MNKEELMTAVIDKVDPYRASKQLQLEYWWQAFSVLFSGNRKDRFPFFKEILLADECWEKTQTVPHMKLNRRLVARKMVDPHSRTGNTNPLSDHERYQVACRCCLEEDVVHLFNKVKQNGAINAQDTTALENCIKNLIGDICCEVLIKFWLLYIINGCTTELKLDGKDIYEYGLDSVLALGDRCRHLEAVEFFWSKIKSLPESKLSFQQKQEIFVRTTVRAVSHYDIFEFCIGQVSSYMYPEILKRDVAQNQIYGSLNALIDSCHFDKTKKLFDCLGPEDISEFAYGHLLQSLSKDRHPTHYTHEAVELFVHVWMKEGFDRHRAFVLREKKIDFNSQRSLVVSLVEQNYMEIVWAVLDTASLSELRMFMKSPKAKYIRYLLTNRFDDESINKLSSYSDRVTVRWNINTESTKTAIKTPTKK